MKEDILKKLLSYQLPTGLLDFFELVSVEQNDDKLILHLDELNRKPEEHKDLNLESKGFLPSVTLEDFPIREHTVYLKVRRRKWIDKSTGKTYQNSFNLTAQGTSYTKEFGDFLKEVVRYHAGKHK